LGVNFIHIHHIGSTAVPTLSSKPKIDILAIVKCGKESIQQIEEGGYTFKGEWNIPFKFGFTKREEIYFNLHVFEEGHPEIEVLLKFRDHLRNNPQSLKEYAALKMSLLHDEKSSLKENGSLFPNYTLGKDEFIREILVKENYEGNRFLKVTYNYEWQEYHRIRKEQIFGPLNINYDPSHPTITNPLHFHFILTHGMEIVATAHIEFLNECEAALRSLATDRAYQNQGFGTKMMYYIEKWLKHQNKKILKMHARLSAVEFYYKLGYQNCIFDDPCIADQNIDLCKEL
jgi:GrpB-like predicted nucleotidyltransferase (UPF0157 family)